jgi:hypothetical protein
MRKNQVGIGRVGVFSLALKELAFICIVSLSEIIVLLFIVIRFD